MSIRSFARGVVAASLVAVGSLSATAGVFVQPTPAELSGTAPSGSPDPPNSASMYGDRTRIRNTRSAIRRVITTYDPAPRGTPSQTCNNPLNTREVTIRVHF